jgi:hypothetical protein
MWPVYEGMTIMSNKYIRIRAALVVAVFTLLAVMPVEQAWGGKLPVPTVISFTPQSGKFPDFVTITGTGFTGATQVTIGGVPSAKIFVDSDTQIRALVRSLAHTGPIVVSTPAGSAASTQAFTVTWTANESIQPPTISSFTPTSGQFPNWVTITGTNFNGATQVTIGGVPSAEIKVDSPTQVRALVRSLANSGAITLTTMGGTAISSAVFTVTKKFD